ncbi:hypothetical protein [Roseateles sp. BYS96W]|uniref:Uncharacterized protein n=1 Tax=Pelomonas nitida TaxID=3299027 RepID=A0ABW7G2I3_9BURK
MFVLIGLLSLAACQAPVPVPPPAPPPGVCAKPAAPPEAESLKAVLAYADELRKTLALAQGRTGAEQAQAAAQLDALAAAPDALAEPLKAVATLSAARLAELRRLQDSVDKLTQQLRDSQRRNEQLNEKLEALKAIEQTLPVKR